ncbi:MAG: phosphate acyltransferase PlsX [Desulfobulbaceae bacterium]|nr:phosphate acyltransferase PlsX [Desulfobulbaceae bacterium]HIJ90495.1 phosphate acyltransferase PlsX [Deltaproteobacteria bacterium]
MALHIALDAMGGDKGPEELVSGAVMAVREYDLEISLVGDQVRLGSILATHGHPSSRIHLVHASQVVGMDESPFDAIRRKKDSSIMKAFALHKEGLVEAVVSAGNSGATLAAAIKSLGRLENVARPGIAGIFPTLKGPVVMMDVGANVDCRSLHLFQFGVMAAAFSQVLFGLDRPRVGLLSIGEEGGKGNALVKKSHELFQQSSLNYIGNVEGRDTFQGDVDVMVCDGFVGNVCLKLSEGLAEAVMGMLGEEISKSFKAKLGYLLAKDAFVSFKKRVDYAEYGGAPLLGIRGNAIICHGRSSAVAIKNAIRVASEMARNKVNDRILELLSLDHILVQQDDSLAAEAAVAGVAP